VSLRRLELLQWFGLLAAPLAWATQLVIGFYLSDGSCSRGGSDWGIDVDTWQIALAVAAGIVAVCGQAAAATLYRQVEDVEDDAPGPLGRLRFFAVASLVGNVLFMGVITLTVVGVLAHTGCVQG
jgi:hypothetical protein